MFLFRVYFGITVIVISSCKNTDVDINTERVSIAKDITRSSCDNPHQSSDYRAYQHGIDFIRKNDSTYYLIWGSSGIVPQGASTDGSWSHDIYSSELNINHPEITATTLISANEAQEPPSSAKNAKGNIFITMEDGNNVNNSVGQRYVVYNNEMKTVKAYPNMIFDGGHSGHVAAVGNIFVAFWSNGWDDAVPGADDIGTGLDVLADVFSSEGNSLRRIEIATDENRDWWPIIAGSKNYACLVWQRYVKGDQYAKLMYSILNPETGELLKNCIELENFVQYYTYDVQYYPSIKRFVITGAYYNGGGFAVLLDKNGKLIRKINNIPAMVREAQGVARKLQSSLITVYAQQPSGIMVLKLSADSINYVNTIEDNYNWFGIGTDGVFMNDTCLYMINLSPCGLIKRQIYINL
jgi:hypothetical protein